MSLSAGAQMKLMNLNKGKSIGRVSTMLDIAENYVATKQLVLRHKLLRNLR